MRNDDGKALSRQAYYEATEPVRMLVFVRQRECQITDYDSRRTVNGLLDTGSTPVYSTIKKGFEIPYFMVFRAFFIAILQYFKPF